MLNGTVTSRYARGLLAYATAHSAVDEIDLQFVELAQAIESSEPLQAYLANPVLPREMKLSTIDKLVSGALRTDLGNAISLLLERGRGVYLAPIAKRYHQLVDEVHGRLAVDIESAQPMTKSQLDTIVAGLERALGKHVEPSIRENKNLIAGYRVQVGNRVLDATTAGALRQFRESLFTGRTRKEGTS